MANRVILTHTLHPKMLRKEHIDLLVSHVSELEVRFILDVAKDAQPSGIEFINAFANQKKLSLVQKALGDSVLVEYSKIEDFEIGFSDLIYIPVIENDVIIYWLKIVSMDPVKGRNRNE